MTTLTAVPAFVPAGEGASISSYLNSPAPEDSAGSPASQGSGEPVADATSTTTEDTSAQQASHRLGGNGGRRAEAAPASRKKALAWQISAGVLILGLAGAVAYLWKTVSQQEILLTSLDTAFRSGQLDSLPQRIQALEEKQQQYLPVTQAQTWHDEDGLARKALETQVTQLVKDSESLRADVTALATQQDSLKQLTDALSSRLDEQVSRIDALSAWKAQREERAAGTAAKPSPVRTQGEPAATSPAVRKPVVSRALPPPFVLTGVERRGGQSYAVVLPAGSGSDWSQLQMLSPGESYRGWTLVSTDGNRAAFKVNGHIQQLTP
ncbi:hypothetical protein DRE43_25220 [Salmonella enterica subsp. enterica serovar Java]|uniref:Uncharacterized protein n=1 Tax=Salmonella enterica TaxID=28901 RepID=A0A3R0Y2M8_SALER|nr:hypothetical protein [Salmonella enterica subsp. diarizonae]EAU1515960.1 hypothetical protein [Salmonella enterica]EBQ9442490.1 hypothetical protein [Salmonella enterica subsp. enterica serovar Cerro]EBX2067889.1 hypothetical protein [Salmonella enterica subsp. enterica serovar Java]EDO1590749.1 hypothetical protein [Salmonella enterica subsp. enterica serovar Adelaide]EDW6119957.1 hypothetical protein [Salmonella enterica subsp. salamae]EHE8612823.1 hypothetical protein [Salmonella enteri